MALTKSTQRSNGQFGTLFDDFLNSASSGYAIGPFELVGAVSGTGAGCAAVATPDANSFGVIQLSTGTTTTGRGGVLTATSAFRFSGGAYTLTCRFQFPTALLDGTDSGSFYLGFGDSQSGAPTDGAYLYWDNTQTNFRYRTRNNATQTDVDSALAPVADTWYKLVIVVNAAGTNVNFTINAANSQDLTTNIPTGSGRETGILANIIKSAGTSARLVNLDYLKLDWQMTSRV